MADRDFIRALRTDPATEVAVGAAERTEAGDDWTIVLARRVNGSDGALLGFIAAPLTLRYFEQFYQGLTLREASAIEILRRDGTRLLCFPHDDAAIGRVVAAASAWYRTVAGGGGDFVSDDRTVGAPSYVSVRLLRDYPLVVDVSVTRDATLAKWWRNAWTIGLGALAIVLAILTVFAQLSRQFRRLATSERLLAQQNADHERTQHRLELQASELRRAAEALARSERLIAEKSAMLETTLEFMGQGILMVAADRTVAVCNQRTIELLGLPAEMKAPGTPFADILAFQWRTDEFRHTPGDIQDFIRSGGLLDQPHVYERRRPDGRVLEVRSTPLPDGGVVRTYADVTERSLAEERAARAREQAEQARAVAEQASRAKTDFLAHMSHEIRTPMNGVLGMNAILLGSSLTAEQRECARAVCDSAKALLAVINDILDISKLEARRVELEAIDFDLVELVEGAVGLLAPAARAKRIALSSHIDPAARCGFRGDPTRLRQVVLNLVGNAIKFTEAGGVTVEVTPLAATGAPVGRGQAGASEMGDGAAGASEMGDGGAGDGAAGGGQKAGGAPADREPARGVRVEVADTGPGIAENVRLRLFEPFVQADSSISRRFGGTGLGLAICRQLVELMGGTIGVTSTPGRGSRFCFEVPLAPASAPMPLGRSLPERLRGRRVLLADDGDAAGQALRRQLAGFGMDVSVAPDDAQVIAALAQARQRGLPFDLAVIDPALSERAAPDRAMVVQAGATQAGAAQAGDALARRIRAMQGMAELRLVALCPADHDALPPRLDPSIDAVLTSPVHAPALLDTLGRLFGPAAPNAPAPDTPAPDTPAPAVPDAGQCAPDLPPLRILVAEDNRINQRLMAILLTAAGHQVTVVDNGEAAVAAVGQDRFDLVLMDIQMPVLDGVGAIRRIRAMPEPLCAIPILALTADAIAGAEQRYLAAGADAYLAKPITQPALRAALAGLAAPRRVPLEATPALDPAVVEELRRIFNPHQFDSFLAEALDDIPQRIARLAERLEQADLPAATQEAHDLVSLIGNCGGRQASRLAHLVEQTCRAGDGATARARYREFAAAAAAALAELAAQRQLVA